MFNQPTNSRAQTLQRLPATVFGTVYVVGAMFVTLLSIPFAAGVGSGLGFVAALRMTTMFFPFLNMRPAAQEIVSWPLTASYWLFIAFLIGRFGRPPQWLRMALITPFVIVNCGVVAELLLRFMGYTRDLSIDL